MDLCDRIAGRSDEDRHEHTTARAAGHVRAHSESLAARRAAISQRSNQKATAVRAHLKSSSFGFVLMRKASASGCCVARKTAIGIFCNAETAFYNPEKEGVAHV